MCKVLSVLRYALLVSCGCLIAVSSLVAHEGDGKSLGNAGTSGSGGNGPFDASNIYLLGRLEVEQLGGGGSVLVNDCWGWTDAATNRKFALVGLTNALSFVEVTDPTNPVYLGKLNTTEAGQNRAWRDVKVHNDHAFVVADGSGNDQGIQVFDLRPLLSVDPANGPQTFTATSTYSGLSWSHNVVVNEATGHGYVVGAWNSNNTRRNAGGLTILDFNDPTNIQEIGSFASDGYTHDAQAVIYSGPDSTYVGREIVFASNEDTLTIVDVVTGANGNVTTSMISRNPYANSSYSHQGWLSDDHTTFYMNDELDEVRHLRGPDGQAGTADDQEPIPTRTHIWDVTDLDNPVYEGFYEGVERTIDHNLYVSGDFIYQANYSAGMRVLKIDSSDPTVLTEFGFFDTYMADNNVSFNGAWSVYPFFEDNMILISDRQGGLFIVERALEPTVTGVELNVDDAQRSAVESLSFSFDGDVTIGEGAVSVMQRSTATEATFDPVTVNVTTEFDGTETTATVQFDSHVRNSGNALVDGNYQFSLNAALVTRNGLPMSEDFSFGTVESDGFYSYYGDSDGNRAVNIFDLLNFRQIYLSVDGDSAYEFYLDFGADGQINIFDLLQFRTRFGTALPFTFGSPASFRNSNQEQKPATIIKKPASIETESTSVQQPTLIRR